MNLENAIASRRRRDAEEKPWFARIVRPPSAGAAKTLQATVFALFSAPLRRCGKVYKRLAITCFILCTGPAGAAETGQLASDKDKLSYGIGVSVARNFKKQASDVDIDLMIKGLRDALAGDRLLLPEKDLRRVMNAYQTEIRQKATLTRRTAIEENRKKSEAFFAANRAKDGVVTLPSGLQYRVLRAGQGRKPIDSDQVICNYRGSLLDGTEFDASEDGKPASLKLSALIAGWKESMKLMPVGAKWQIFIPPQLAYGERGVGSDIGPNETLIFEVELLAIN
ncbi:MAG: peptidylprolyl isomerase, FKBP-type [Proteobacteria bacterium]|nr:peptidylprolyl isomerase, FKBP-type [Pseudomonadota bacterium]